MICWTHLKVKLNPADLLDSPQTQSCWGAAQAAATCCSGTSPWPAGTHVLSGAPARACRTAWSWWPAESCTHPLKPAADRSLLLTLRQCIKNTQLYLTIGGSCHKYHFCHNKHVIVATKQVFCHDKVWLPWLPRLPWQNIFGMTKVLSRQAYFCCDRRCVLSQQTWYLWQLPPMTVSREAMAGNQDLRRWGGGGGGNSIVFFKKGGVRVGNHYLLCHHLH